jgi:hypothetical protein
MTKSAIMIAFVFSTIFVIPVIHVLSINADVAWSKQTVDSQAILTTGLSLALDPSGNPHMVYAVAENGSYYIPDTPHDVAPEHLMYASKIGSSWYTQTIDNEMGNINYNNLAIDFNNVPYIVYTKTVPNTGSALQVYLAAQVDGNWSVQIVDYGGNPCIALDSANNPHIAYIGEDDSLKYASWNGLNWAIQVVDSNPSINPHDTPKHYLALDPKDQPIIVYDVNSSIKLAMGNGSGWRIQTVVSNSIGVRLGNVVADSHGYPHFTYRDLKKYQITYESWNGSAWSSQNVTDYVSDINTGGSFLALDAHDNPHIAYRVGGLEIPIMYASLTANGWDVQTAVSPVFVNGLPVALALDANGNPHIGYMYLRDYSGPQYADAFVMYATATENQSTSTPTSITPYSPLPTVPEFSMWITLPLMIFGFVIAVKLKRRKR